MASAIEAESTNLEGNTGSGADLIPITSPPLETFDVEKPVGEERDTSLSSQTFMRRVGGKAVSTVGVAKSFGKETRDAVRMWGSKLRQRLPNIFH